MIFTFILLINNVVFLQNVWFYNLLFKFFLELVIDEGEFQNDDNYQFELLPKKQKQLYNRIQSRQKNVNFIFSLLI